MFLDKFNALPVIESRKRTLLCKPVTLEIKSSQVGKRILWLGKSYMEAMFTALDTSPSLDNEFDVDIRNDSR